jgi:adenylate cyclase
MGTLLRFRHFQSRLLVFLLIPLLLVLAAIYTAVTRANTSNALAVITSDLRLGATSFTEFIDLRDFTLAVAGDALASDFATREALATNDPATILSAMDNLLGRLILADFVVMVDEASGLVSADTLNPERAGTIPPWNALLERARELDRQGEYPEAADTLLLDGSVYHLTVIPFFQPDLAGWIVLGFEIDQDFTETFGKSLTASVTVLFQDATGLWQNNGSTLPLDRLQALMPQAAAATGESSMLALGNNDQYVTLGRQISSTDPVFVVLQRSLAEQLEPYEALRQILVTIFALGLVVLVLGVLAISRKVTCPVQQLAAGARLIEAGDYQQTVDIPLHDEIGELAQAFNGMAKGLAEKERVRNLLGKVVSPEVASELLKGDIELGGEEREVTVLFSDVRGFTSLCEGQSPKQILSLLNEYFSAITAVIEANGGVVDKFIGDAVMALFGAPVAQADATERAIRTAFGMEQALAGVNASFAQRGLPPIAIGIGINTGKVVAGNMGSPSRLNYTVIGDGVNLASRLEGLTKQYGTTIIVSEACVHAAPAFAYRELGVTQVKGRQEPVRIFAPLPR